MKSSKYILRTSVNNKVIYYNLVNRTLLEVTPEEDIQIQACLSFPQNKANELWSYLYDNAFIFDDNYDELKAIKVRHWKNSFDNDSFEVTILPTLRCNEKCTYCYERQLHYEYLDLSKKDYDDLYAFLNNLPQKQININWFGGEPMLCKDKILKFCQRLNQDNTHTYTHSISSNATIFDPDFLKEMVKLGLKSFDTTIVGNDAIFSKLGRSHSGNYTNVKNHIIEIAKILRVIVCINLCSINTECITNVLDDFSHYPDLPISFSFLNITSYDNNPCPDLELDRDTYMKNVIKFSNYALDHGLSICDMSCFDNDGIYCGAYVKNNFTITPGNYVFKCESNLCSENSIGRIINGKLETTKSVRCDLCIDPYTVEKCQECKILPYCNGGCKHMRNLSRNFCPVESDYVEDYLKLYYRKHFEKASGD